MNGKTIKLNDGTIIPLIGLGTHKLLNPKDTVYEWASIIVNFWRQYPNY